MGWLPGKVTEDDIMETVPPVGTRKGKPCLEKGCCIAMERPGLCGVENPDEEEKVPRPMTEGEALARRSLLLQTVLCLGPLSNSALPGEWPPPPSRMTQVTPRTGDKVLQLRAMLPDP
jgi:hypothetical protein